MKIGIDCRMFSTKFTGIGRYTHELVDHIITLNSQKKHPDHITLFFNEPEYSKFTLPSRHVTKVLVNAPHYSFSEQTTFLKKLNAAKLDIVHFPHFNLPLFYRRPYVVTIHDLTLSFFPGKKMTKWYHRFGYNLIIKNALKKSRHIIAISQNTKNDLINFFKVPSSKITVIYNGLNPEFRALTSSGDHARIQKTLQKYHINKDFLLYTGVWRNHKNLPRLIKAFQLLRQHQKLPLKLVITGKEDPYYPEVKQTVAKHKLQKDVIFPGLVSEKELIHLYNAASIYVFPSLYEGFGLPPLEAMACHTPVAASDGSSIPEICGTNNALFFDPYDPKDIAAKITQIYQDASLRKSLVANGGHHAQQFSWDTTAQKTYSLIREYGL